MNSGQGNHPGPQPGYGQQPMQGQQMMQPAQPINIVVQNTNTANAQAGGYGGVVVHGKPPGSWLWLIVWLFCFWPSAIWYYMSRSW